MPNPNIPPNLPTSNPARPEDIFEDTETIPSPSTTSEERVAPLTPKTSPPPPSPFEPGAEVPKPKGGKTALIIGIVAVVLVLAGGVAFLYIWMMRGKTTNTNLNVTNAVVNANVNKPVNTNMQVNQNVAITNEVTNTNQAVDTDGDGLLDTEEKELGTNPQKADTDNDGLFDLEEVRVYKTDPVKSDTDGDSYLDGNEVKAGYDPNGPGKLRDIGEEINKLTP